MSYNPISFEVIRQALSWSNIPTPHLTKLSTYKLPNGTVTAQYRAIWPYSEVADWTTKHAPNDGLWLEQFLKAVTASFCEDITTMQWGWNDATQEMCIDLHVRVPKRDQGGQS